MSVENQVCLIWAVTNGYLDKTPVNKVKDWQTAYLTQLKSTQPDLLKSIAQEKSSLIKLLKF